MSSPTRCADPIHCADLVSLLARRADEDANLPIYSAIADGRTAETIDCATLFRRARAIAARLQRGRRVQGERVMLPCPSTLDAITAFWAIVCAGAIPVPVPPLRGKHARRLGGIVQSCRPTLMLLPEGDPPQKEGEGWWDALEIVRTVDVADEEADAWSAPGVSSDATAFLQYTSGSTGLPKGVIVSHDNLMVNARRQEQVFELEPRTICLIWLPLYHDMGLIGGVIQAVFTGYPARFMPPAAFVERPLRWLEAISAHRVTVSGGPNFGYELTARALEAAPVSDLDLRSWRVGFCGAEPVREETLERFTRAGQPYGLDASVPRPCYGLAEATLLVSAATWRPRTPRAEASQTMTTGAPSDGGHGEGDRRRVAVGPPAEGLSVAIVNPETSARVADGESGEVWIAGDGVAQGYWGEPDATREVFGARLAGDAERTWLRTGDVGLMRGGELFILDRLKDVIIIRGTNYFAHDIETAIESAHLLIRTHGAAAIGTIADNEEQLVVVVEVERGFRPEDAEDICARVQQRLADAVQLTAHAVVLVRPGAVPRTSSGKIRRRACRDAWLANELKVVGGTAPMTMDAASTDAAQLSLIGDQVRAMLARLLRVRPADVPLDKPIGELGVDSVRIFQAKLAIEGLVGAEVAYSSLLDMTVNDLLAAVMASRRLRPLRIPDDSTAPTRADADQAAVDSPLSSGQRALLYMDGLRPEENAYTIARALVLRGPLDAAALRSAFEQLGVRHEALRMTVTRGAQDEPAQRFTGRVSCEERDAAGWSDADLERELTHLARTPFDLGDGPLVTAHLFRRSAEEHVLLFRAHHLAVDLWSLALLIDELEQAYRARKAGLDARPSPARRQFSDFAAWQRALVRGDTGTRLSDYWFDRLKDHLDIVSLPSQSGLVVPPEATPSTEVMEASSAGRHAFELDAQTTDALRRCCREQGATLNTLIIAAYQILLARYGGQRRFLMGTLASGRTRPDLADVIGYCVNLIPLRADVRRDLPFAAFLRQTRVELNTALDHQDLPFSAIVERLSPQRTSDRSPLIRAVCVCQPASIGSERDLGALVLNLRGGTLPFDDLRLEPLEIDDGGAQFDLSLLVTDGPRGLTGMLRYDRAQFRPDDIALMASALGALLRGIAARPDAAIGELPLVSADEYRDKAARWNETERPFDHESCIHDVIARQAAETPEAAALVHRGRAWTYADLQQRVDACAARLHRLGVGPETRVAVCLDRSMELVAGLLGVLRAGGAYVALDPSHPSERLDGIVSAAAPAALITSRRLASQMAGAAGRATAGVPLLVIEDLWAPLDADAAVTPPLRAAHPDNAAYVMYMSGSTGVPKGVVVSHRNVMNLFAGMDAAVGCGPSDTLVAVTSVAFDISVVELLWTLARGARVVIADEAGSAPKRSRPRTRDLAFSLFYFADSAEHGHASRKYELLLDGAAFADRHGFTAVWTPERHFHPFGGLYPNPLLTSAALATVTSRVQLRAGSVVLPLHHPIRVAEEWAEVDNLSGGRVGVAFASGWHAEDFAFQPEAYADRKAIMLDRIDTVRALWRGESVEVRGGDGQPGRVRLFPRPIQPELPIWLTAAGSPDTFEHAARLSANVLTHLLGQSVETLRDRAALYTRALADRGVDPAAFGITLMLHAYVDESMDKVAAHALEPFKQYLRSSLDLVGRLIKALNLDLDLDRATPRDIDALIDFAAQRYMGASGLFGTPREGLEMLDRLRECGVSEVACLIDFGVERQAAMASLERIGRLKDDFNAASEPVSASIPSLVESTGATLIQCTPSMMAMMVDDPGMRERLAAMRAVMLGGEPLPIGLLADLGFPRNCLNMYGPTETTVWSAVKATPRASERVTIGGPLTNTQLHVLDASAGALPEGVVGEVWIGGAGVARGYWNDPALTAERFIPDPWSRVPGARLYRTGDVGRAMRDGAIELLGRADQQVKLRGYRVELGDVEAAFNAVPGIRTAVVVKHEDAQRGAELVAYVVPEDLRRFDANQLRDAVRAKLPPYMVPGVIAPLPHLPVTANRKVDRAQLARLTVSPAPTRQTVVEPRTEWEARVRRVWQDVLGADVLSVHDNFFDVGGHSLLIIQVHERLQREIGWTFPLQVLLERPTIGGIAEFLEQGLEHGRSKPSGDAQTRAARQRRAWQAHRGLAVQANPARDIPA